MKKLIISALLFPFLISCTIKDKKIKRFKQIYEYSSIHYIPFKKGEKNKDRDMSGNIKFEQNYVTLNFDDNAELSNEKFHIKKVTTDDKGELTYKTAKGNFYIKSEGDTIKRVSLSNDQFMIKFNKDKFTTTDTIALPEPEKKLRDGWKRLEIANVGSIDLPPKMEIQSESFKKSKKQVIKKSKTTWNLDIGNSKFILQPKGVNAHNQSSLKKYARIIFNVFQGKPEDFHKLNNKLNYSEKKLTNLNQFFRNQIKNGFERTPLKLIQWYPTELVEINGMQAINIRYKRQLKQQPYVLVNIYRFQNYDRMYSLTISYRENEKKYWKKMLDKVLHSFRVTNIK